MIRVDKDDEGTLFARYNKTCGGVVTTSVGVVAASELIGVHAIGARTKKGGMRTFELDGCPYIHSYSPIFFKLSPRAIVIYFRFGDRTPIIDQVRQSSSSPPNGPSASLRAQVFPTLAICRYPNRYLVYHLRREQASLDCLSFPSYSATLLRSSEERIRRF